MHTISAQKLKKDYTQVGVVNEVLKGLTYTFESAHSYAIAGVSGTGKSTLLHILAGIDYPTSGDVLYNGISIYQMPRAAKINFLRQTIGLVFQDPHLIKELTVIENVMLKALISGRVTQELQKRALSMLEQVGLADKAYHHPLSLSGGQQQRVAVLRALFSQPQFILADEPTGNLDANNAQIVLELLLRATKLGMGLIVCSHDPSVWQCMKTQLVLEHGVLAKLKLW